jgi:RNA polymerase sigma-70 factor (ECF subfamily)
MAETDTLQSLLEQLGRGDPEAAHRAFLAYEPFLRMVVRRQLSAALRAKFDSTDVVQSVWADLLSGFQSGAWCFESAAQLQAFLLKATHNRLIDRVRREQGALRHERRVNVAALDAVPQTGQPEAGAGLEAEELWERMLALCPPQHRELLRLKRQGVPLADIAARTGLHPSSVRRVLYDLAARLAGGASTPAPPQDDAPPDDEPGR